MLETGRKIQAERKRRTAELKEALRSLHSQLDIIERVLVDLDENPDAIFAYPTHGISTDAAHVDAAACALTTVEEMAAAYRYEQKPQ